MHFQNAFLAEERQQTHHQERRHQQKSSLTTAWGQYTTAQISRIWGGKIQLIKSWAGESLNVISQRRGLHVSHWSVSEFGGLKDWGAGLPRLDRDSYWVHSSLGSDKGLRASDESDNGSRPCLCPTVVGFGKERKKESRRTHRATAGTISAR